MALAVLAIGGAVAAGAAKAAPVLHPNGVAIVDDSQIVTYRGVQYCWYDTGWSGPGWYQCGFAWRRGFGWGGPYGWHGWHGGHHHQPRPPRPGHPGHPHQGPGPGKPGGGKPPGQHPPGPGGPGKPRP